MTLKTTYSQGKDPAHLQTTAQTTGTLFQTLLQFYFSVKC